MVKNKNKIRTLPNVIGMLLVVLGMIGFIAASTLAIEKVALLKNPEYVPSCNLNPVLSCGSVMSTHQAEVFGFPNPFIGVAGFAIVVTVGMGILAGAKYKRWYWLGLEAGTIFGVSFVHWLIYQSIFVIGALCPYCMVVWAVTIPIFLYVTLYNMREGHIRLNSAWLKSLNQFVQKNHGNILFVWYSIIFLIILNHFWYYWQTLI